MINMLSRILTIFAVSVTLQCIIDRCEGVPVVSKAKSRQYIEPLPGLVPVYIRPGETPLEDINLDLAEAFDSYAKKHGRVAFARANEIQTAAPNKPNNAGRGVGVSVEVVHEIPFQIPVVVAGLQRDTPAAQHGNIESNKIANSHSQHIQKIPKS